MQRQVEHKGMNFNALSGKANQNTTDSCHFSIIYIFECNFLMREELYYERNHIQN